MKLLSKHLEERGIPRLMTSEPGGTPLGLRLRELLLNEEFPVDWAELFLYLADRAQHVAQVVNPALEQGKMVLCDRFYPSTIAYQGYGRGLDLSFLREANRKATGGLKPDVVVLLDTPIETALDRITAARSLDRMESESLSFHERVREGFLEQAREEPGRFLVIDGAQKPEAVFEEVLEGLGTRLPLLKKLI